MESRLAASTWIAFLLGAAACSGRGTDLNQIVRVNPLSDSGGGGTMPPSYQDPFAGAPPYTAQQGNGAHNPGTSCNDHHHNFLIGGTVYKDYQGTIPAVSVEVRLVDPAGNTVSAYSGPEGNFYIDPSNANGVTLPATVGARDGTTTRPMITTLTGSMGSCGQSPCHVPGGGPMSGTGNYYPIHVP